MWSLSVLCIMFYDWCINVNTCTFIMQICIIYLYLNINIYFYIYIYLSIYLYLLYLYIYLYIYKYIFNIYIYILYVIYIYIYSNQRKKSLKLANFLTWAFEFVLFDSFETISLERWKPFLVRTLIVFGWIISFMKNVVPLSLFRSNTPNKVIYLVAKLSAHNPNPS